MDAPKAQLVSWLPHIASRVNFIRHFRYDTAPIATKGDVMEKGLLDVVNVLDSWVSLVFNTVLSTILLPFRLIEALFS
jgi:hypothetical protein